MGSFSCVNCKYFLVYLEDGKNHPYCQAMQGDITWDDTRELWKECKYFEVK